MPQRGIQFHIVTNQSVQQVFQSTGSIRVLNPNDGVCYVALDRKATFTDWDHKLPSQSYGQLPGPLNNYISIFYLDQSGTGSPGDVVLYQSAEQIDIPVFLAIGRAIQSQVTTLDIIQGTQPGNPPAGVTRLWSDPSGNVYHLSSTGTNVQFVDTANLAGLTASVSLGGDLYGTVGNGHVNAQTNPVNLARGINVQWGSSPSSNTNNDRIVLWTDGNMYLDLAGNPGTFNFRNAGATVATISNGSFVAQPGGTAVLTVTPSSWTLAVAGTINGSLTAGDIHTNRGNNTGVIYLGNSSGQYLYFDGTNFQLTGANVNLSNGITVNGTCSVNGTLQVSGGNQIQ